jgi:DNA-binding GntR family transcriptional regulator
MAETIKPPARAHNIPAAQLTHRVSSSLLTDQIYEAMRGWIAQGDWPPGTQLRIREVAKLVGTSEMPVREAFRRLEQAGLIVVEPYKGAVVRVLSIDELEHIYDVRIMLEAEAGRQGALRADADTVAAMTKHWQQLQEVSAAGDVAAAVLQDEYVLLALYSAGENDVLTRLVRELWDSCRPYKHLWVRNAVAQGISAWSHLPHLNAAVENHDSTAVFDILTQTYRDARATVRQLLTSQSGTQQ